MSWENDLLMKFSNDVEGVKLRKPNGSKQPTFL